MNTNIIQSGAAFGIRVSRTTHQPTDNSVGHISAVSINGFSYNGSIFDTNGTRLYWRLCQLWCYIYTVADWMFTQLYRMFSMPTCLHHIRTITSNIDKAVANCNVVTFNHTVLSDTEHVEGCKLGIDSWEDTWCAGKHAFVEELIEGKNVTATGFKSSLESLSNITIADIVYAYDAPDGTVLLLECNNLIYFGHKKSNSLLNPIQSEEVGVRVDTQPKRYWPNDFGCQSLHLPDGTNITVLYEVVIPYIPICCPKE